MSVIIGRALPDVRDGLKPAHRRVLYGMKTMGLSADARLPQVRQDRRRGDGQLPSPRRRVDLRHAGPDGAGLQHALTRWSTARGTSARSTAIRRRRCGTPRRASKAIGDEMMADLDKETVDFVPNYDETTEEPTVLPAPFPNLLVNGSAGIAVGMATNIPPHNMRRGDRRRPSGRSRARSPTRRRRSRRSSASCSSSCPAPTSRPAASSSAARGSSRRTSPAAARSSCARRRRSRSRRRATARRSSSREIPYQVNKARLIERIAELVREKTHRRHLRHPRRIRSRRHAHRHRPEARRGRRGHPEQPLQAHAAADARFGIIMLAIVGGRPKVLSLVELHRQLRRVPPRGGAPADGVRAAEGRSARAHPRRAEDRARSPRRGDRADPRARRTRPRRAKA